MGRIKSVCKGRNRNGKSAPCFSGTVSEMIKIVVIEFEPKEKWTKGCSFWSCYLTAVGL